MKAQKSSAVIAERRKSSRAFALFSEQIRHALPPARQLLTEGGDDRIQLDPLSAANKYGCREFPDPDLAAFGSSTASVISARGYAAADQLRHKLLRAVEYEPHSVVYARELNRIRCEFTQLCGVSDLVGLEVLFAASGTDIHLLASQLNAGTTAVPALAIMVDAVETGSCVQAALAGRHFSTRAALGGTTAEGESISGGNATEVAAVTLRLADGKPRQAADIDAEVELLVSEAVAAGRRVLLLLVDVSKTGLIAPSPSCVMALREQFPDNFDVMVDACQFRIAPSTLRAYLQRGFMVALTGSKFVTGPTFSGALLFPAAVAQRLRGWLPPRALRDYSLRADWPSTWTAAEALNDGANFGLLLRWEAALQELREFYAVPETVVAGFLQSFADAVRAHIASDPAFETLPVARLDRRPLVAQAGWDHIPTIFPFVLYHRKNSAGRVPLTRERTAEVYKLLQKDLAAHPDFRAAGALAAVRCQLGQPVACGIRDGVAVSAMRLCASARLVVEATASGGRGPAAVIERALAALGKAAALV